MFDKRALKILINTYWSNQGWINTPSVSHDDLTYARNSGYMFEDFQTDHENTILWLKKSFRSAKKADIVNAFLASLSTRRLELRSALGSYATALNFPIHNFNGKYDCTVCGSVKDFHMVNLNLFNFERYKWGGVRHYLPEYIAFDLERFSALDAAKPIDDDKKIMREIIDVICRCTREDRPSTLEKKLAKVFKSNQDERKVLIEILAYCGILRPKNHPTFLNHL
jgi:hypothetical protein